MRLAGLTQTPQQRQQQNASPPLKVFLLFRLSTATSNAIFYGPEGEAYPFWPYGFVCLYMYILLAVFALFLSAFLSFFFVSFLSLYQRATEVASVKWGTTKN